MAAQEPIGVIDVIVSLVIGGFFGYVTGGFWNVLQGRRWSGKGK